MGTARDRAPHRTAARGFAGLLSSPPEVSVSSRHLLAAFQDHVSRSVARTPRTDVPRGANLVDLFYLATSPIT